MSNDNNNSNAVEAIDNLIANGEFSAEVLERLAGLEAQAASQAPSTGGEGTCVVTLYRHGKNGSECFELPASTTISEAVEKAGWASSGSTIQRMDGRHLVKISSPSTTKVGEGDLTLLVTPHVSGGSK